MRYFVVALLALAFPASGVSADGWPAVSALASKVAGKTVEVRCATQEQWDREVPPLELGYTDVAGGYAVIPPAVCGPLVLLIADPNEQTSIKGYETDEGRALLIFLHESTHLSGVLDEAQTECRALGLVAPTLSALGVGTKRATRLMRAARGLHLQMPPSYRTSC